MVAAQTHGAVEHLDGEVTVLPALCAPQEVALLQAVRTGKLFPAGRKVHPAFTVDLHLHVPAAAAACLPQHQFTRLVAGKQVRELRRQPKAVPRVFENGDEELEPGEVRQGSS